MELLPGAAIDPSDVRTAVCTHGDLPAPPREPRECLLGVTEMGAARRGDEAGDVMDDPTGVDEGVLVRPGHLGAVPAIGDPVVAYDAPQRVVISIGGLRSILRQFFCHE